jgi:ATP-binding cassette subfamily C protein
MRRAWRGCTAYVPQEGFMLAESLADNLRLADPQADEAALWTALEIAAMDHVVRRWPNGLSTILAERGQSMSGGERQRLALARALVRKPALLVLDEATNALDAATEAQILDHLASLKSHMTVVIFAHSPAALRIADHVIALERGRLLGQGSPAALQSILAACFDRS